MSVHNLSRALKYFAILSMIGMITIACKSESKNKGDYAYIGGEIINPKNKTVTIYNTKGDVIDSIGLDKNNRFIHKMSDLQRVE